MHLSFIMQTAGGEFGHERKKKDVRGTISLC